jgi:glucan phosphoethanolaminetransferase (alkaline phosphatase superfamily)
MNPAEWLIVISSYVIVLFLNFIFLRFVPQISSEGDDDMYLVLSLAWPLTDGILFVVLATRMTLGLLFRRRIREL